VKEINDDHLPGLLDEDHEMRARPRKAQILGQVRVDQPPAIL
jgi:hypothetical protein